MYLHIWRTDNGEYHLVDEKGHRVGRLEDIIANNADMVAVPRSDLVEMRNLLQNPLGGYEQEALFHRVGDLLGITRTDYTNDPDSIPF